MKQRLVTAWTVGLAICCFSALGSAATITVTTTSGAVNLTDNLCSLREAVQASNTDANYGGCTRVGTGSMDTIVLGSGTYTSDATLTVTSSAWIVGAGQTSTTISVPSANAVSVQAPAYRTVVLKSLRLTTNQLSDCVVVQTGIASISEVDLNGCYVGIRVAANATSYVTTSKLRNGVFGASSFGKLELYASEVTGNSSTGVSVGAGGSALFDDSYIANNRRSGIVVRQGKVTVESTYIQSNHDDGSKGGGIRALNDAKVEVRNSTLAFNESTRGGGGINSEYSDVTITDSLIDSNFCYGASCNGGGIRVLGTGSSPGALGVQLTDSTVSNNLAQGNGGGVALMVQTGTCFASLRSTLARNTASLNGGGLYSISQQDIIASTISSNVAGQYGGGIYHQGGGELHVYESTIALNQAATTGGLYVESAGNPMNFGNIIAMNSSTAGNRDLRVPFVGAGFTWARNILLSDSTGIGTEVIAPIYGDPRLTDLAFVDGHLVHRLNGGSPAIMTANNANAATTSSAPSGLDQLGRARPVGTRVDLGSVEYNP